MQVRNCAGVGVLQALRSGETRHLQGRAARKGESPRMDHLYAEKYVRELQGPPYAQGRAKSEAVILDVTSSWGCYVSVRVHRLS